MKHEKEVDEALRLLGILQPWFADEDLQEVVFQEIFGASVKVSDIRQKISNDIETGVKNGMSVEDQMKLLKRFIGINKE